MFRFLVTRRGTQLPMRSTQTSPAQQRAQIPRFRSLTMPTNLAGKPITREGAKKLIGDFSSTVHPTRPKEDVTAERLESFTPGKQLQYVKLDIGDQINVVHKANQQPSLNYVAPGGHASGTARQLQEERALPSEPEVSTNLYALHPIQAIQGEIGPQRQSAVFQKDVPGGGQQLVTEGNAFTGSFGTNAQSLMESILEAEYRRTGVEYVRTASPFTVPPGGKSVFTDIERRPLPTKSPTELAREEQLD
jgi:hypothetical protein